MKRNIKILIIVLFTFIFCGEKVKCEPIKARDDSSAVDQAGITKISLDKYRHDQAYNYDRNVQTTSNWDLFWEWLMKKLSIDGNSVLSTFFNRNLWYVIFIIVVIFIVYKLFGSEISSFFYKSKKTSIAMQALEEDINVINFEEQIKTAISQGNFRYAIRLYYLKSLKELNEKSLITWEKDKTNKDYYYELAGSRLQQPFGGITSLFNWIWYGDKPLDFNTFETAREQFNNFNLKMGASSK